MIFIAHRGASYEAPENTLAAVNLAWQKGALAVEVDVHLSLDHRIMVIHDPDTKRTTDQKFEIRKTQSDKLRTLDAGSFKDKRFSDERIPFLEEILETIPEGRKLIVEIKSDHRILPYLAELIETSEKRSQLVMIAFDFDLLCRAKKMLPGIPAYWLHFSRTGVYSRDHIGIVRDAGLNGLNFYYRGLRKDYVEAVHRAGLKIFTWTIDLPALAKRLILKNVDGIATNRIGWLEERVTI